MSATSVIEDAAPCVDVSGLTDAQRPQSWSSRMVALLRAGHYREGYEILSEKMPFVDNMLRPYAERLAGGQNHWTLMFGWINRFIDSQRPQRILDVGCGIGPLAIEFAGMGHQTCGIDILPQMIERGRELIASLDLSERARLIEGDIRRLERHFEPCSFDAAVACDIFEHLDDAALLEMLGGLTAVLRPGGTLVVQTSPGRYYYWFDPSRWKVLSLLVPFAWLPDRLFTRYARLLEWSVLRHLRLEHKRFYWHEYGHINCMDHLHLARLLERAGFDNVYTFAVNAHPGFKDEGASRSRWTRRLFGRKSIACRNVFGVATVPA